MGTKRIGCILEGKLSLSNAILANVFRLRKDDGVPMNTQMIWETAAVIFALLGLGIGVYVTVQRYRGDLNLRIKANIFIILGGIEGIPLVALVFPLLPPTVKALIVAVTHSLGLAFLFSILVMFLLVELHRIREKHHRLLIYVLLSWLEYFVAIGVVFVVGSALLILATNALSTVAGNSP